MKKSPLVLIIALAVLGVLAGPAFSQGQKKPDIAGTWVGTAVVNEDGTQLDIIVVIEKAEAGYAGKLSDTAGQVPESPLREIVFKDNKLTCAFDLAQATGTTPIKIELTLENETLKGVWSDPDGNSGTIELKPKK